MTFDEHAARVSTHVTNGMANAPGITYQGLRDEVSIDLLDMLEDDFCIIGQVYGDYDYWMHNFSIKRDFAAELGMVAPVFEDAMTLEEQFEMEDKYLLILTAEWIRRIILLRGDLFAKEAREGRHVAVAA